MLEFVRYAVRTSESSICAAAASRAAVNFTPSTCAAEVESESFGLQVDDLGLGRITAHPIRQGDRQMRDSRLADDLMAPQSPRDRRSRPAIAQSRRKRVFACVCHNEVPLTV